MPIFRNTITFPPDRTRVLADELSLPVSGPITLEVLRDHPESIDEESGSVSYIAAEPKKTLTIVYIAGKATMFGDRCFIKKFFEPESFEFTLYNPTITGGVYAHTK
jgi:hypothetical protein